MAYFSRKDEIFMVDYNMLNTCMMVIVYEVCVGMGK